MIYMTLYDPVTKQAAAPSTDSGFKTIDEAVASMGDHNLIRRSESSASYRMDGHLHVFFSRYAVRVDECL